MKSTVFRIFIVLTYLLFFCHPDKPIEQKNIVNDVKPLK
ncbi:hypothetical protein HDC90_000809 [Pedobacter sp. AK013]|nr:hypothetical protein [Pedobacter sp. AK013]